MNIPPKPEKVVIVRLKIYEGMCHDIARLNLALTSERGVRDFLHDERDAFHKRNARVVNFMLAATAFSTLAAIILTVLWVRQ